MSDLKQISKLLDDKLAPIHEELKQHGKILEQHGKILQQHGKILKSLKKDQSTMLRMLDSEQMQQRKRLNRIEDKLNITPTAD